MIVYQVNTAIQDSDLVDLGAPENLGGKVLEGNPKISARIDYKKDGITAGIFEATTGTFEVHFPYTEHATILEGEVTITDKSGLSYTYCPGDSFVIKQGEIIIWEVKGTLVRKSFLNVVE